MALTRAQLLMGDIGQGAILTGQAQGVRPGGAGITIRLDGVIETNSQTVIGLMKLGQTPAAAAAAFNGYTWPLTPGSNRQQLTTDGTGILSWQDADHIPWTAKGQLIVGTGVETDIILDVGSNTSLLVADSTTPSGLNYTNLIQTAILLPTGTTLQRPTAPVTGQFRWNTTLDSLEVYDGFSWEAVASEDPDIGTFVPQTVPANPLTETGSAVIPAGTTAERQTLPPPQEGNFRWNEDYGQLEVWNGTAWAQVPADPAYDFVLQTRPAPGFSASAVIPRGNSSEEENPAVGGYLRYNTDVDELQFFNGTNWDLLAPSGGGVSSFVQATVPTARNVGDLWYDTVRERESVWDGSAWVQPGVTQTNPTGAAFIPYGATGDRGSLTIPGQFRYNTSVGKLEFYTGTQWEEVASMVGPTPDPVGSVTSVNVSGGTTGFNFTGGPVTTTGTMTMSGTLSIANGGTGQTSGPAALSALGMSVNVSGGSTGFNFSGGPVTSAGTMTMGGTLGIGNGGTGANSSAAAINNLLPGQGGNNGKVLTTDGSNVFWGGGSYTLGGVGTAVFGTYQVTINTPQPPTVPGGQLGWSIVASMPNADPQSGALSQQMSMSTGGSVGAGTWASYAGGSFFPGGTAAGDGFNAGTFVRIA